MQIQSPPTISGQQRSGAPRACGVDRASTMIRSKLPSFQPYAQMRYIAERFGRMISRDVAPLAHVRRFGTRVPRRERLRRACVILTANKNRVAKILGAR